MTDSQKIDAVYNSTNDIKIEIAKAIVKIEQQRIEIDGHTKDIKILEAYRNTQIGKVSILSLLFGSVGAGIFALIKHLSHG